LQRSKGIECGLALRSFGVKKSGCSGDYCVCFCVLRQYCRQDSYFCAIEYFLKETLWNHRCTIELNRLWKNSAQNTLVHSSISLHSNEMTYGYFIAVSLHIYCAQILGLGRETRINIILVNAPNAC
jgi:hypothetical protein